ncbi:MAG: energy-coupling factor transporter transmembrane protein EcfT [Lachnospiraceae bacterium]|nr:energy-coupling factor transporter transmembrane protein EcfT [Lachnospiraceae bacterium]
MFREITIGQYYPADSLLHRLDPRVKLFFTLFYMIGIFVADNIFAFSLLTVGLFSAVKLSKVPFGYMVKGLQAIILLLIIAGAFNMFLTPGQTLATVGPLTITDVGLKNAGLMTARMIYLIIGTSLMTLTTTPNRLTDGLETSLGPLQKLNVPVHEIALMMSIALRFIPILVEETDKIMKAQMARGADFETKGLVRKAKAMVPLLVPLFVSAFRRASDLAMAMEARCYHGGEGRTKMKPLHYSKEDRVAYLLILLFFAGVVVLRILF